jgi:hypothetical protein
MCESYDDLSIIQASFRPLGLNRECLNLKRERTGCIHI